MQVEHDLSARALVELHHRNPFRRHALHRRLGEPLHRRHRSGRVASGAMSKMLRAGALGMISAWPSARGMMSMNASADLVLEQPHAGRLAAQDLGEYVVGVVGGRHASLLQLLAGSSCFRNGRPAS